MYALNCLLLVCMIVALNACVESRSETEAFVNQVKKSSVGKVDKIPEAKQFKSQDYTAGNLRSPFEQSNQKPSTNTTQQQQQQQQIPSMGSIEQQPRPDADRPREYLEQFPLSAFTMVGTLSKPEMNWGLIKDSSNTVHAVKVGDYMGQNSGKVIAITPDQIRLTEMVPNGSGGWMLVRSALTLAPQVSQGTQTTEEDRSK